MAATAHAQLIADLDDAGVTAALRNIDKNVSATAKGASREFQAMDRANAAMASKMQTRMYGGAKSMGGYRAGQVALQAQDVAIQMQMGVSASRILVQQGTQIASIFGPAGAIIGGLTAMGVLIYQFASGTEAAEKKAAKLAQRIKDGNEANLDLARSENTDEEQIAVIEKERTHGKAAADRLREQIDLQNKANALARNAGDYFNKDDAINAAERLQGAKDRLRNEEEAKQRRMQEIGQLGKAIIDRADEIQAGPGARGDKRRAERARNRALRRAAIEDVNKQDKDRRGESGITPRPKGLTPGERKTQVEARIEAAKFQEKNKITATVDKEGAQVIADAVAKLITK